MCPAGTPLGAARTVVRSKKMLCPHQHCLNETDNFFIFFQALTQTPRLRAAEGGKPEDAPLLEEGNGEASPGARIPWPPRSSSSVYSATHARTIS